MGAEDRNEAVVRRFWDDVWVRGNFDVLREVTTEDFRCYAEPFAMDRRGMQWMIEAREFAAHYLGMTQFPPTPFVIDRGALGRPARDRLVQAAAIFGEEPARYHGPLVGGTARDARAARDERWKDGETMDNGVA